MSEYSNSEGVKDSMAVAVPGRIKVLYGMGASGTQLFNGIQAAATAWFWLKIMNLDAGLYAIVMVVFYNIWNALNDPIFGWISDRTRSRWGRRIPYIRFFTPIWLFCTIFLFFPFLTLNQIGLAIWLCVFILLFDTCYTMVAGCYNSLMPELSTMTTERTRINQIAQLFAIIGVGASFIFPLLLKDNVIGFFIFVIVGSTIAMLVLFIPSFFIKERVISYKETPLGFISSLKYSIQNRAFMSFVGWNFMVQFTTSIVIANIIFYATYVLRTNDLGSFLLFGALIGTLLPGFIISSFIGKKLGVKRTVLLSTFIIATGLLVLFLSESYWMACVSLAIAGFGLAGVQVYAYVMVGEATDYDELKTHQRREAMFFGTNALFTKPAIGIAHGILAWTLASTGYNSELPPELQLPSAIFGIRMLMGLFPSIALYISLIFLYLYPNRKEVEEMKRQLAILHTQKE
jgi:GPH family glycoside/pentoside/hexuronide:cation symporter